MQIQGREKAQGECRGWGINVQVAIPFILAVLLDQASKIVIRQTMYLGQSVNVLGGFLRLTYIKNPGIAFGIRVNNPVIFTGLSIAACAGIVIYLIRHWHENIKVKISLALILGGAVGNLIDRIRFGEVVDFIDVGIHHVRWPVFNVADSAVVIGMLLLFYCAFFVPEENKKES